MSIFDAIFRYSAPSAPNPFDLPNLINLDNENIQNASSRRIPPLNTLSPECQQEWLDAHTACARFLEGRKLGEAHSWIGRDFIECLFGQVSEECGGNPIDRGGKQIRPWKENR